MTRRKPTRRRRLRNAAVITGAVGALVAVNGPVVGAAAADAYTSYQRDQAGYKAEHGHWDTVELPEEYRDRKSVV